MSDPVAPLGRRTLVIPGEDLRIEGRLLVDYDPDRHNLGSSTTTTTKTRSNNTTSNRNTSASNDDDEFERGLDMQKVVNVIVIGAAALFGIFLLVFAVTWCVNSAQNLAMGSRGGAGDANATALAKPAIFDRGRNHCGEGYDWYPNKQTCEEHHAPKFVEKAKCKIGEVKWVPDPSVPGGKRELTCGIVPRN